jgi:hypothetical protein
MSAATVRLNDGAAIVFDAVRATAHTTQGVLLTLEGRIPGNVMNCAVIPLDRVRAVIASLTLVAEQARAA